MKKKAILTTAILCSLMANSSVYAQINERPVEGKQYNEYLYYDSDGNKSISIQNIKIGEKNNYYFNEGATLDSSNGSVHATILTHNWGKNNSDTYNIFNIGKDKNFTIVKYGGEAALNVQEDANLEINGGNIILDTGLQNEEATDNTSAAIFVEDNSSANIKAQSLIIGNTHLEEGKHNAGAISAIVESEKDRNSMINIDLDNSFIADNVSFGIAIDSSVANKVSTNITAGKDIKINAFISNGEKVKGYNGAGIYALAYHDKNSLANTKLVSKNGDINISAQGYGYYGYGSTKAEFEAKNGNINLFSKESKGVYTNGTTNNNKLNFVGFIGKNVNISGDVYGINSTNSTIENKSDNLGINGKSYGIFGSNLNFTSLVKENTILRATNGWGICLFNKSIADVSSENLAIEGYTYAKDSNINLKANEIVAKGQVNALNGSTINFNDNGSFVAITNIEESNYDAVTASSNTDKNSEINFTTNTIINAYADKTTKYHDNFKYDLKNAIKANKNSKINLNNRDKQYNVFGDIEANGENASVNIDSGAKSILIGDMIAQNKGSVNIVLTGANIEGNAKNNVFLSDKKGDINLDLKDTLWYSRGKSSVDKLNLNNSIIDLTKDKKSSVIIDDLSGNGTFNMHLNSKNKADGDMLYVGTNNGIHNINVVGGITGGVDSINENNTLRFATVVNEQGSMEKVQAYTKDAGIWNVEYIVKKEAFDKNNVENEVYNGKDDGKGTNKPGNDFVENTLVGNNTSAQNWVITGVKAPTDNNGGNNQGNNQENNNSGTQISNAGKTILAMSKVNYANAVYMDRLNKRMGEANYIDGDDGLWLRIRHDRIGKENAFRSKNTMFEVGYDNKVNNKENHRQGIAFDYMRGSADYSNVIGSGNVHRAGVWLYDTQYDEQGAYTDFVIKAGKLTNDFDLLAKTTGENIHGEYDNMVYALSAEYGKKIAWKNDWYIEPQAQIQYAHVTGAEYTTSQGTQVSLDGIDSLIARAGLKIGKDINQKDNIYFKADVLHEFLGDQDISAGDKTGRLYQEYDNKGTWYDLGFGFTHRFDENTYMYADVEQSFGNDNEDTYQFNLGLNVKF